jgi:hypothetical protein
MTARVGEAGKSACVAYSDHAVVPGFHNSSSHGGPVRAGLQVRIHYAPGVTSPNIVKLEVADCG